MVRRELFAFLLLIAAASAAQATPAYSIRAARACNTCHIEPIGWLDPPKPERGCTLDCQACHTNRSGGGLRNAYGRFYARQVLPTFALEDRPAEHANPEAHRSGPEDKSSKGRYRLFEGFSGWQRTGTTPVEEIEDRVGDIDPERKFRAGFDARLMAHMPLGAESSVFPMQMDAHAWGDIHDAVNVYGTVGLAGRRARTIQDPDVGSRVQELITVRELAVEYDKDLPMNGYVRAGRFRKPYGWRIPDHTAFTRNRLGYGQFNQVWGVEGAINPNYPWLRAAAFVQGWDIGWQDRAPPGIGVSATGGFRELGWQAGGSFEALQLFAGETRITTGPLWGLNAYPFTYLGELDVRFQTQNQAGWQNSMHLFQEVSYWITRGVTALVGHTWLRNGIARPENEVMRFFMGTRWDALAGVQFAGQYRLNVVDGSVAGHEFLLWTHLYY